MKKYITPITRTIELNVEDLLASSPQPGGVANGDNLGGDTKDDNYDDDNQFVKGDTHLWSEKW